MIIDQTTYLYSNSQWITEEWQESYIVGYTTPPTPQWKDGLYFMLDMGGGIIYLKQL
jgi:hypothetical protein